MPLKLRLQLIWYTMLFRRISATVAVNYRSDIPTDAIMVHYWHTINAGVFFMLMETDADGKAQVTYLVPFREITGLYVRTRKKTIGAMWCGLRQFYNKSKPTHTPERPRVQADRAPA